MSYKRAVMSIILCCISDFKVNNGAQRLREYQI